MPKVIILGVGNLLLKDEGIGVHVAQYLMKEQMPSNVEVVDGGTAAFDLIPVVASADKLIVVDAMQGGGEPGSIYRLTPEDITMSKGGDVSLHDTSLIDVLEMAARIGNRPETVIFGVEPAVIAYGIELTEEIKGKIPRIVELVLEEVG